MNTLALFDLDGTLTCEDTMLAFLRQRAGAWKYAGMLLVAGALDVLGKIGIVPADAGKKRLMRMAFAGASVSEVAQDAERFAREAIPGLMRHGAMERVRWHRQEGHRVIVVSASCGAWLRPWCDAEEVELIATELETRDGRYTGELCTPNCKGQEKVRRLKEEVDLAHYARVHAYGDTPADRPMLALATDPHYRPFHAAAQGREDRAEEECGAAPQGAPALSLIGLMALVLMLSGAGAVLLHKVLKPMPETVATGTFVRVLDVFPRSGDWPDVIHFMPDHHVTMKDRNGTVRYEGRWHWNEKGHSLRLDDPAWDRRVAWVPGWGGPRLRVASPVGKDLFQTVTFRRAQ